MCDRLVHRGPDGSGTWFDREAGIALGHRRLAVLDLSPAGDQPMVSESGRYVISFNGEIYNHLEIRRTLERRAPARGWIGRSDTETLLAAFEAWTPESALERVVGMFALAVWDRMTGELFLARDRLGEKPLYYGWQHGTFLFASELKALRAHPAFTAAVNRDALTLFLRFNCVPGPYSIYEGIHKLQPGHHIRISLRRPDASPAPYWSGLDVCNRGKERPFKGTRQDCEHVLTGLLKDAVAGQMVADVPVGAFLSGGIDSSLVVALMQSQSSRPVRTFTIGFPEREFNEAHHAARVAKLLGTEHTELYVSPREALDVVPDLAAIYDEPFADSSQIPTLLISRLTRREVTVSLSGDGGDELFAGYNRYMLATQAWRLSSSTPRWMRRAAAGAIDSVSTDGWNRGYRCMERMLPSSWRVANAGEKLRKLADTMEASTPEAVYLALLTHWKEPESVALGGREPATLQRDGIGGLANRDFVERMMFTDMMTYLPDDILCKVDRAAMSVSLETRVPFLDHRVVEFAWTLPLQYRLDGRTGKRVLRDILGRHLPLSIFERPKMGFGVPLQSWLRGPLRDWCEALLDEARLRDDGCFDVSAVRHAWREHLDGRRDRAYELWDVLMFQAWLDQQRTAC
jgi:asparagine synthase (glutamine-hydrolysing)